MNGVLLVELLGVVFLAVACFWARPQSRVGKESGWRNFPRLANRIERLRRSRWQWFSMLATMLALRMQSKFPPTVELTVGLLFLVLLAFPIRHVVRARDR